MESSANLMSSNSTVGSSSTSSSIDIEMNPVKPIITNSRNKRSFCWREDQPDMIIVQQEESETGLVLPSAPPQTPPQTPLPQVHAFYTTIDQSVISEDEPPPPYDSYMENSYPVNNYGIATVHKQSHVTST